MVPAKQTHTLMLKPILARERGKTSKVVFMRLNMGWQRCHTYIDVFGFWMVVDDVITTKVVL